MTAADVIAALDAALAVSGETVTLKRPGKGSVDCRASVRGMKAEDLVGTATVSDLMVVISPTEISAAKWPTGSATAPTSANKADPRVPKVTDLVTVKGRQRQVKFADPIYVGDVWVRTNLIAAG